jgi:hypothetical protein
LFVGRRERKNKGRGGREERGEELGKENKLNSSAIKNGQNR